MSCSQPELILASSSPRRKEILAGLGISFHAVSPSYKEVSMPHRSAREEVLLFAEGKALSVANQFDCAIVIGSDTLIEYQGEKIGKPVGPDSAEKILHRLQGKSHQIWTAVFLIDTRDGARAAGVEKIEITMHPMTDYEIKTYVATGEPLDKAGAYAIQGEGRRFIHTVKGNLLSAIGLPVDPIKAFLRDRITI